LPRDAQDQWRISERLRVRSVKPGDLIFLSKKGNPDSINHVMLYLGDENYIEAPETGMAVRIDTLRKRFGVGLDELTRENFTVDNRHVYFGRIKDALFSAKGTE
jgi:cell wall-associated NlpC family hydrolase